MDVVEALIATVASWAQFPVEASERPLILTGQALRESGYVSSEAKMAFAARRLRMAPGVADGAVASLIAAVGPLASEEDPALFVTSAVLVVDEFGTDRGPQSLAAWSFQVTGSIGPVVVLDVGERARMWSSSLPDGAAGSAHYLDHDGTRLRYRFFGSPREYTDYDGADVVASPTAVAVAPRGHDKTHGPRAAYAQQRAVDIALAEPLGARVLVSASGSPIEVHAG